MKTCTKNLFLAPVLITGFGLILAGRVTAQTFTTLYSFTATPLPPCLCPNSDGAFPAAGLILSSNTFYRTTHVGGTSGAGGVFAIDTNGSGFTSLYSFTGGSDGSGPHAGLISSGNTLYGTASGGGSRPSPLSLKRRTKIPLSQQGAKFVLQNETTAAMAFPSGS